MTTVAAAAAICEFIVPHFHETCQVQNGYILEEYLLDRTQRTPQSSTAQQLSSEWSHLRVLSIESKLCVTQVFTLVVKTPFFFFWQGPVYALLFLPNDVLLSGGGGESTVRAWNRKPKLVPTNVELRVN